MFVIRPIRADDIDALEKCAFAASLGITNLPKDRKLLTQKIETSLDAFAGDIHAPVNETYLFVLEDLATGVFGGTCGIFAKTGVEHPSSFYHVETLHRHSHTLPVPSEMLVLRPVTRREGPSEICGLFLMQEFRKEGVGQLLSLCRFLFMAAFPQRFDHTVIAELRGVIRPNGLSPFWEGVGRHFLNMKFHEILSLIEREVHFTKEILPEYPIYADLLPTQTRLCIGKTHPHTRPALKMLQKEGFRFTGEIDLFDGGPKIEAPIDEIRTFKESQVATVEAITDSLLNSRKWMISNQRLDFRASYGSLKVSKEGLVTLPSDIAEALEVGIGDTIRYVSPHPNKARKGS